MCTYVWGNLVTWRSKKQSVVSRSSAEAELRSLASGVCEGIWLKRVLDDLKIIIEGPIKLFCDNQAALSIAKNPVHHDRTKHIEIDRYYISDMEYIPSGHQLADILTKALPRATFSELCSKLDLLNIYSQA